MIIIWEYDKNIERLWEGVENQTRLEYTFHRAEQSRAEQRLTASFLRLAAARRLKLNTTFVMDNRLT